MAIVYVNRFDGGIADDRFDNVLGEYGFAKHFDILSYPRRLQPLRGMQDETVTNNPKVGNIIVASNGYMYGIGVDNPSNPTLAKLWARDGYGAGADKWTSYITGGTQTQLPGVTPVYDFLVDWPDCGHVRSIHYAANGVLCCSDPAAGSSVSTTSLSFSSIGQGIVHPKDKYLYIPYRTSSTPYIAQLQNNASAFGALSATAFTLPSAYRAYCLSYYGNYLAIPLTQGSFGSASPYSNEVALWNRDTSTTTFDEVIPWGSGSLQVLNNLQGYLVGINTVGSNATSTIQDHDAIQIKVWNGGAEPTLIRELHALHLASGSGAPFVTLIPRVNFVYNHRLYFSARIDPNDGIKPAWTGLFSVGQNKLNGRWSVILERVATSANTETAIIAAAIQGDFVAMSYSTDSFGGDPTAWTGFAKTLAYTINGTTSTSTYATTSTYESLVNQNMPENEKPLKKQLTALGVHFQPFPSGGTLTMKYRVDSNGNSTDWQTFTLSPATGDTEAELPVTSANLSTTGRNFEFRIESVGGVVPIGFVYKYDVLDSELTTP